MSARPQRPLATSLDQAMVEAEAAEETEVVVVVMAVAALEEEEEETVVVDVDFWEIVSEYIDSQD